MTTENPYPWADRTDCAVTVCDTEGVVIYQNVRSHEVNGDCCGRSLLPCHNDRSRQIIDRLLSEGGRNVYTIRKRGVRKLIYQTVWRIADGPDTPAGCGTVIPPGRGAETRPGCGTAARPANGPGPGTTDPGGGRIGGLVEFSLEIPEEMPHYNRE